MKAKLSYKSKRNIVISVISIVIIAIMCIGVYMYTKGNDKAQAYDESNAQLSENKKNTETQNPSENSNENSGINNAEETNEADVPANVDGTENQAATDGDESSVATGGTTTGGATTGGTTTGGATAGGTTGGATAGGTTTGGTTGTTTGEVPNTDYVTERVEEQEYLASEDYTIEWAPLSVEANIATDNLQIVRPILASEKTADKTAVVAGEELEYTITVRNSGNIAGKAVVQDNIPEGTTFMTGSIKVTGAEKIKVGEKEIDVTDEEMAKLTEKDLANGIEINVAKKDGEVDGVIAVSFTVKVNEDATGTLSNKAEVNGKTTEEVKNPIITSEKEVDIKEIELDENNQLKENTILTYTITMTNNEEVAGTVTVKDEIPEGTEFIAGSIKINGASQKALTKEDLAKGIDIDVNEKSKAILTFKVKVIDVTKTIVNTAYVNEKPTDTPETKIKANIIFVENGGTEVEDMTGYAGEAISNTTMPVSSREGYILDGWYAEAELTNKVESLPSKYVAGTTYYYAKWIARDDIPYIVEYYYQQDNGEYPEDAQLTSKPRPGTTDTKVFVTEDDKKPALNDGKEYTFDATNTNNVLEGIVAGDGSLVLKVYFKQQLTVKYNPGTHGTFEEIEKANLNIGIKTPEYDGAKGIDGKPAGDAGYTFTGWSPEVASTVTQNVTYVAQWKANENTPYIVEYYYQQDNGEYPEDAQLTSNPRPGTTDTKVFVTEDDKKPALNDGKEYTFDATNTNNVLEGIVAGDGSLVLKVYFKQQLTVKYNPGTHGTFEEIEKANLNIGIKTPEYDGAKGTDGKPAGDAGYTFTGWSPEVASTVTQNVTYVAQWKANENTPYIVEYYYQQDNGEYPEDAQLTSKPRPGITDTKVFVTEDDKKPALNDGKEYTFDATNTNNVLEGIVAGDGSLVLKVYFKQQLTVKYNPGTHGTFEEIEKANLNIGIKTPDYDGAKGTDGKPAGDAGYTFTGWSPEVASTVTQNVTYVAQWEANTNTPYIVEHWQQDIYDLDDPEADKNHYTKAYTENLAGTTGELAQYAARNDAEFEYIPSKTEFITSKDNTNLEDATILGDGTLVIRLYYDRNKYDYTVRYYLEQDNGKDGMLKYDCDGDGKVDENDSYEILNYTKQALYNDIITKYEDKLLLCPGYELDEETTGNVRLQITKEPENNIINVYYQLETYNYTVEYYVDGVKQTGILGPYDAKYGVKTSKTMVATDSKDPNWINKKRPATGYTEGKVREYITIINGNNVIRVDYVIDENQKKTLSYTVEYYVDGELNDTQVESKTVQVLQPNTMDVNMKAVEDKKAEYEANGYTFEKTVPTAIPATVDGTANVVIKVYYISECTLTYYVPNPENPSEQKIFEGPYTNPRGTEYTIINYTGFVPEGYVFAGTWTEDKSKIYLTKENPDTSGTGKTVGSKITVSTNTDLYAQFKKIDYAETEASAFWNDKTSNWSNVTSKITPVVVNGDVQNQIFYAKNISEDPDTGEKYIEIDRNVKIDKVTDITKEPNKDIEIGNKKMRLLIGHKYKFTMKNCDVEYIIITVK